MPEPRQMGPAEKMRRGLLPETPGTSVPPAVVDAFRSVFSGRYGREVLESQLRTLKLFERLESESDMSMHNYAIGLLESVGTIKRDMAGNILNMTEIVSSLVTLAQLSDKEDDNAGT